MPENKSRKKSKHVVHKTFVDQPTVHGPRSTVHGSLKQTMFPVITTGTDSHRRR